VPATAGAARLRVVLLHPTRPELKAGSSDCRLRRRLSYDPVVSLQLIFEYGERRRSVGAAAAAHRRLCYSPSLRTSTRRCRSENAFAELRSRLICSRVCRAECGLPAGLFAYTAAAKRFPFCQSAATRLAGLGCCCRRKATGSRVHFVPIVLRFGSRAEARSSNGHAGKAWRLAGDLSINRNGGRCY
jgi:hypothetical protein